MTHKVALFVPNLHGGGAQRVALNLAEGLVGRGCSVDLLLANGEGALVGDVPPAAHVVDFGVKRTILSIPYLAKRLSSQRYDALISFMGYANICATISSLLSRGRHVNIVTEHVDISYSSRKKGVYKRILRHLRGLVYPRADSVVAVSKGVADGLIKMTSVAHDKVSVIYNPIVTDHMEKLCGRKVDHPWFARKEPVILGVGRLAVQKNFSLLVRAFNNLNERRPARLVILGEGEKRSELERLIRRLGIEDRVYMPGFVQNPYSYMASADVLVLSSDWEGFGNVLVEAMACGTPVVSTDCPSGPSEILEDGEWGRLVSTGSMGDLAEAILATLDNPIDSDLLRKRAQRFSADRIARNYIKQIKLLNVESG